MTLSFLLSLLGCGPHATWYGPATRALEAPGPPTLVNPERGWRGELSSLPTDTAPLTPPDDLGGGRYRLLFCKFQITPGGWTDADARRLDALFAAVRRADAKCMLRFSYFDDAAGREPAVERVLGDIEAVGRALAPHWPLVSVVQHGFIGRWGEMHGSSLARSDWPRITARLADIVDDTVPLTVRTPALYDELFVAGGAGGAEGARFGGQADGVYLDCFLSSPTDVGTFAMGAAGVRERDWLATFSAERWVDAEVCVDPTDAERTPVNARMGCDAALEELSRYHVTALNAQYGLPLLRSWLPSRTDTDGCVAEVDRRLGYRFEADWQPGAAAGEGTLTVRNAGWSRLVQAREASVVWWDRTATAAAVRASFSLGDATVWGAEAVSWTVALPKPTDCPSCRLGVWLPDADAGLGADPGYSVQLLVNGAAPPRPIFEREGGVNWLD